MSLPHSTAPLPLKKLVRIVSDPPAASSATALRVLIVEHSAPLAELLAAALRGEGMVIEIAPSGSLALAANVRFRPDVALIDLGLPDMDGLELVERFARDADCGIIAMTANAGESARVIGLEIGADDYVAAPPPLRELAARIRAVQRRRTRRLPGAAPGLIRLPQVTLDCACRRLSGPDGKTTALTEAEFAALTMLLEADGASVPRHWLSRVALKRPLTSDDRGVDQLVLKLRRKLALHGVTRRVILSSRGLGYVIPDPGRLAVSHAERVEVE